MHACMPGKRIDVCTRRGRKVFSSSVSLGVREAFGCIYAYLGELRNIF